ncbi:V-type ATP synthase subunit A [Planctomycetota bacterium]
MSDRQGRIVTVSGSMISVAFDEHVRQNEVAFAIQDDTRLKSEVIRVRGKTADLQVFEDTRGLRVGDTVLFADDLLSVELGPGLLSRIFDGLQNPLPELATQCGHFLQRGVYLEGLPRDKTWHFTPAAREGDWLAAGHDLGAVPEGAFDHKIKVPFSMSGRARLVWIAEAGEYTVEEVIARVSMEDGGERELTMLQRWPVKVTNNVYKERLSPGDPLVTGQRIIDTLFPVRKGETYCIPGPFGAGKTVMQHIMARHADVDIVIVAACGERAGEVVEVLTEFPKLTDPRTGRTLMERTVIICNTSSMPVAAREASIYTAVSIGEYYRSMGYDVLLLADSTSRWAQALREMSGRLEEIPGEEAFPAYLESRIAEFYERAGRVRNHDGETGTLTIGGTVSPAGGNFNEPVTQATLKVVKAFHGLSRARSDARRFPAIDPLESWSTSEGIVAPDRVKRIEALLRRGEEIRQMMTVVGHEGISTEEYAFWQKAEIIDRVYLQQNAFHAVDSFSSAERQQVVFDLLLQFVDKVAEADSKENTRNLLLGYQEKLLRWNSYPFDSDEFEELRAEILDDLDRGEPT